MNGTAQPIHLTIPQVRVEPLHPSVTETHSPSGATSNLHVSENGDLAVQDTAKRLIGAAEDGCIVIALDVDDDHDEVQYACTRGADTRETLRRAMEALNVALTAVERVMK